MFVLTIFAAALFGLSYGLFEQCDYFQKLEAGRSYPIASPNYPNLYGPGISCRWTAVVPATSTISINCQTVQIPSSAQGCTIDRLSLSLSGDPNFSDERVFCGTGTLQRTSNAEKLVIGLVSSTISPGGRFYCVLTVQTPCQCGRKRLTKIVGGVDALVNEFPFHAALVSNETNAIQCGATIISNQWVVLAAHCFTKTAGYGIITGESDTSTGSETIYTRAYLIERFITHASYNSQTGDYDIALAKTVKTMDFNIAVGAVCLPFKYVNNPLDGSVVTAVGWGTLDFGGPIPVRLQKVQLNVITNAVCQASYSAVTSRQICTYTPGKDTCQYDSGGGLYYTQQSNLLLYLVGITNYGFSCASTRPSVSARVTEFLSWIQTNTPTVAYCNI